ncbi:integrin alpha-7-like [Sinocyclocheilus rhinocerous]|uniref:integrin alpha-7-like n=1 Tax=Sinocyclocheilus rhinocerous TaxID=307959 RepID=UPI0007B94C12|nr:PREDICTED: integrin alpha-7-like [Sinocyclocheilus rhinocerous]
MSLWRTQRRCTAGLCCLLLALCSWSSAFNLDTTTILIKEGEEGSFFGFSLALHQQLTPEPHSWILVGAPQSRGTGTLWSSRPGALYRCPVTPEKCERVDIDGHVNLERESKDNQWLGVTVKSQGIGGKVVTCAHLYELRQHVNQTFETRDPIGRCYVLSEDLTERDDLDGGEWKFCEGRSQGHEQFGFCQQGLSASFTPDKNYILFGAPGTYNWKGLLFMANPVEDALVYKTQEPSKSSFEDVAQNSYLGFSVDSARGIMSKSELTFVAGAPRAKHTGAVVLLRKDNVYRLMPDHILWGEELASSFGYSVAVADLNSDGWTDLVVGAPNFFDRKAEIGGAVYVYLNPASHWEKARPIRLNGTYDSMFGMTVSSAGDLDQDGYEVQKILVGAPQSRGTGTLWSSRPGALYRCPVTPEKCERVDIDGHVNLERESKDNQWLGVTVKSQGIGGKVVTCAHLYELRQHVNQTFETRDPIGRCYVLSEDLTERDDLDGGEWKFCEGRSQGHEQFGFCQQGLSASFTPDKNYILFGAPGTYNWKGLLFMANPVEDALVYKTQEPSKSSFEDVAQNSYLGFSVDSARGIMSKSELTFVAGAPRAKHTGAVVLLRKDNVYRLMPDHILWGEELASSFGYSVAVADLNSDGWTDLVVGAPNFFDRKAEIGGAVYVYLNPASHWEKARPIRLNGTYDSMFGMTVSSAGDLDQDGYEVQK